MAFFKNLFGGNRSSDKLTFHSGAQFVGAALLIQYFPEDRPFVTDDELHRLTAGFDPKLRNMVQLWIVLYVTLLKMLATNKFGDEFGREVMAAVYGRIAANEDRIPGIDAVGDGIKYWFKEMDAGAKDDSKCPTVVGGQTMPLFYLLGIRHRNDGSQQKPLHVWFSAPPVDL
jgi:hypothetical protein